MSSPDLEREISELRTEVSELKAVIALSAVLIVDEMYVSDHEAGGPPRVSRGAAYLNKLARLVPDVKDD